MASHSTVGDTAQDAGTSRPIGWMARIGMTARATIYLVMGWLAILTAQGSHENVDQRGALTTLLEQPFGELLVLLLALGFIAYALWRFSEVAFGVTGEPDGPLPRVKSLIRGLAYAIFAVGAFAVLNGARQSQTRQQESVTGATLGVTGGQLIVGAAGAGFAVAGAIMVWEGFTRRFIRYFDYLPPARRRAVLILGTVGTIARGVVFALAGVFLVGAAVWSDATKAGGINEVVHVALARPFGGALVTAMGVGLVVFGIYGLAEALWRRVPDGNGAS